MPPLSTKHTFQGFGFEKYGQNRHNSAPEKHKGKQ